MKIRPFSIVWKMGTRMKERKEIMKQKGSFRIASLVMILAMVCTLFGVNRSYDKVSAGAAVSIGESTVVPDNATGFFQDDLGTANSSAVSRYKAYSNGGVSAKGDYMQYTAEKEDASNGIKLDVTSTVKKSESGTFFGASLMMGADNWNSSANMFFEVVNPNGDSKKYELAVATPGSNTNSNSGMLWNNALVSGESSVWFGDQDSIYLCVNQNSKTQCYDEVCFWGYPDEFKDADSALITTPELNAAGDKVEFRVSNLTAEDKQLAISITNYATDGSVSGTDKYDLDAVSGMEDQEISLSAVKGSLLTITDASGNKYYENYKIGTYNFVSTWANAEETADINGSSQDSMPPMSLTGSTYRQIIRVTTGGTMLRLKFSNQYGASDLEINSLHIAKQIKADESEIDTSTDTCITFNGGNESVTVPAGETVVTDPIEFHVDALENLAVTAYFGETPKRITSHRGARATQYITAGNHVANKTINLGMTTKSWYFLCDISMLSAEGSKAVVCFGDSITDGYGTDASYLGKKPDSYTRWGDYFAKRLQTNPGTTNISVLNEGIGSNAMFGGYPTDAGKDRFKRDLLEHDGVAYCIILFGVNDLNKLQNTDKAAQMITEYEKMVKLCHENGIKIYGAPILPFGTSDYYSPSSEEVRTTINDWMRSSESGIDGIIDFESAVKDPNATIPSVLEEYTHADGLHPYDGYSAMADAIDLSLFK